MTSVPPQKSDLRQPKEIYQDRPLGYKMETGNFKTHTSQVRNQFSFVQIAHKLTRFDFMPTDRRRVG